MSPKSSATAGQRAWNGGLAGEPAPGRVIARPSAPCTAERCGQEAAARGPLPAGMVRVPAHAGHPPRIYCAGWCALYAQALADVRGLPGTTWGRGPQVPDVQAVAVQAPGRCCEGDHRAYLRHIRRRERPCPESRNAARLYEQQRVARRKGTS
ncbi:hypothetical protein RM780_07665 [Streptomyces sp. DSM 44917]|uniref:Uncharacterized protein n=1 Tax=Streptomyces boetiae TaxID=3075541 RepID=A0ABU2L5K6_9ACTN|nr:hypothetical protein [Streptomyces sp. DSM 44917]MDT0306839.1 hypothetical protein [Streptomyces sp. DSM 44917]